MRDRRPASRTTRLRYVGLVGDSHGNATLYAQQEHLYGPAGWRAVGQPLAMPILREIVASRGWIDVVASAGEAIYQDLAPAPEPVDVPLPGM